MFLHGNVMVSVWHILGEPSYISGILSLAVGVLSWVARKIHTKIDNLKDVEERVAVLEHQIEYQQELILTLIANNKKAATEKC